MSELSELFTFNTLSLPMQFYIWFKKKKPLDKRSKTGLIQIYKTLEL